MRKRKKLKKHVVMAITAAKETFDNLGDEYTVYKQAKNYGVCRNVLQKAFKEEYGHGIRDYRLKVRMEKSKDLLAEGKDAKEVSITLRYSNPSAFNNAFKRYWKVTPKEMFDFTQGGSFCA